MGHYFLEIYIEAKGWESDKNIVWKEHKTRKLEIYILIILSLCYRSISEKIIQKGQIKNSIYIIKILCHS